MEWGISKLSLGNLPTDKTDTILQPIQGNISTLKERGALTAPWLLVVDYPTVTVFEMTVGALPSAATLNSTR